MYIDLLWGERSIVIDSRSQVTDNQTIHFLKLIVNLNDTSDCSIAISTSISILGSISILFPNVQKVCLRQLKHAEIMKNVYAFIHKCVYCFNPVEWSKNWLEGWWKVETHFGQVPIFVSFSPRNPWNMLQLLIINQIFSFLNWMKNVGRVMIWVFGRRVDRGRWSLGGGQEDWRR